MVHFSDFFSRFSSKEIFHQFKLIEAIEPPLLEEKKKQQICIYTNFNWPTPFAIGIGSYTMKSE